MTDPTAFRPGSLEGVIPKNPDSFKQFFRMNSSTFEWLCGLLEPLLECRDPAGSLLNLPADIRLGIGLFRLATGSDYPEISTRFRVSEFVSKFCVKQLCRVLCTNYRFWVGFPSENDLSCVSNQFENLSGMPNCCGIIDCTRFKIIRDQGPSDIIAAQIVVDAMSRILSIAVGFTGNKSDFEVLKLSTLYRDIQNGNLLNSRTICINDQDITQYLVAFQQYPLLPWLMVPFVDTLDGSRESNFNNMLKSMCLPMSKAIRSLKSWGVLSSPVNADIKTAVAYVGTCSILHNMLLSREDFTAFCNDASGSALYVEGFRSISEEITDEKASAVRNALAARVEEFNL